MISQYANSPVITKLDEGLRTLFDDTDFTVDWYNAVFDMATATGFGLDIWGRILDRNREFVYNGTKYLLQGEQTIDGIHFTAEEMENLYRKVLQLTAMRYLGNASISAINQLLDVVFREEGKCYCIEYGVMQIRFVFRFYMNNLLKAIIENLNPHPSGVLSTFEYLPTKRYFGFFVYGQDADGQPYLPFDNGPFYR